MKIVKELPEIEAAEKLHPRRRLAVVLREDDKYTFVEQYHYTSEYEGKIIAEGWASLTPEGIYATADKAEADGRAILSQRYQRSY